jgi:phosphoenolpyruvate-protein phosphotransferase
LLERALGTVRSGLSQTLQDSEGSQRGLIEAHLELLGDPQLHVAAQAALAAGKSAGFAWRRAIREAAATLQALEDRRMRERAADLLDLEAQVLRVLRGEARVQHLDLPERAIVVADELLPSQLLALDSGHLVGVCTAGGGVSSHVALLAAARGLPMLVALGAGLREVPAGSTLVLDADRQRLETRPSDVRLKEVAAQIESAQQAQALALASAGRPARTLEGTQIAVYCNLGHEAEVDDALRRGAEGCGLLRSEFLFLERSEAPDEEEQLAQYQRIARAMGERVLTIRTLDAGGDKPIAYLDLPPEENPALGLRGIRTSLWAPELLRVQLRAIVRVQSERRCRILLPMVTDLNDLRTVRAALLELSQELELDELPQLGVMIETPASALLATQLCREADFLSIGTNDLAQYTLAMDRGQAQFASRLDALHPAVLALVAGVCAAAHPEDKEVAVCGGLASDPLAVPLLLGLGVRELSCVPRSIPMLKQLIRSLRLTDCRQLADKALQLPDAQSVRALSGRWLEARGAVPASGGLA